MTNISRCVTRGDSRGNMHGVPRCNSRGVSRGIPRGNLRGVPRGNSRGVPRGDSHGVTRGDSREKVIGWKIMMLLQILFVDFEKIFHYKIAAVAVYWVI